MAAKAAVGGEGAAATAPGGEAAALAGPSVKPPHARKTANRPKNRAFTGSALARASGLGTSLRRARAAIVWDFCRLCSAFAPSGARPGSGLGRRPDSARHGYQQSEILDRNGIVRRVEPAKRPSESKVTLQHFMMPEHANPLGNVHGGVIMKLVDEAAAICSMRHAQRPTVTVAIDSMSFRSPVHVGELISLHATLNYVGRTSMEVGVHVMAENPILGTVTHTNSAYVVLVALDERGQPCLVRGLELTTDEERARFQAGKLRQAERVKRASAEPPHFG